MKPFPRVSRRKRNKRKRKPINVLASVMTTMNLYCGVASIFASIGFEFKTAALFILLGIFFDTFDGIVARITNSTSEFGKELDSLCDIVTFGIAPAVLVFVAYLPDAGHTPIDINSATSIVGRTGSYMAIVYAICTALRLARYNTYQSERRDSFVGLPSPAAGGTLAAFVLFLDYFNEVLDGVRFGDLAYYALGPVAVILALLMVSTVEYPRNRFKAFVLAPRHAFISLAFWAFVISVMHYALTQSPFIVLFPLAATYVFFGIGDTLYMRFIRRSTTLPEDDHLHESDGALVASDPTLK